QHPADALRASAAPPPGRSAGPAAWPRRPARSWARRGPRPLPGASALFGAADVDLPDDPEAVGGAAVEIAPHLPLQRHRHGAALGELLVGTAQHGLVIAHEREGDVGALHEALGAHALDDIGDVQADEVGDLEAAVHDLVGAGVVD